MRNLRTIEDMELKAQNEFDSIASKRIRNEWLSVERIYVGNGKYRYEYKWGKNVVPRDRAATIIASA